MAAAREAEEAPGALIWTLPEPPGRPTTSLSRGRILAAALAVADAAGARALTMRRIAAELGSSTPMSLYRYVGSKDGLVDLMIDAVYGEVELPDAPSGDWRADVEELALRTWEVIGRHLWFGELIHTRPPVGPNALRYFDYRFAALEPLGADANTMSRITAAVDGHLFGAALQLAEENRMRGRTGIASDAELRSAAEPILAPVLQEGGHPAFARWFADHDPAALADNVEWVLSCLLDGIAARLAPGNG
jgi:AcrR family transcriptional regulator